jgi:hypothetical protein
MESHEKKTDSRFSCLLSALLNVALSGEVPHARQFKHA